MERIEGFIETIFRFPNDKPLFIGVVCFGETGTMLNAGWVKEHSTADWQIKAHLELQSFKITLFCTELKLKYTYTTPMINQQELSRFIEETKKVESFNFGHVSKSKGVYTPVRTPFFKPWVLPCSSFEFTWEY